MRAWRLRAVPGTGGAERRRAGLWGDARGAAERTPCWRLAGPRARVCRRALLARRSRHTHADTQPRRCAWPQPRPAAAFDALPPGEGGNKRFGCKVYPA